MDDVPSTAPVAGKYKGFLPGNKAYRRRVERVAEKLVELRQQYEPSPLLPLIAKHLIDAERLSNAVLRQRSSNAAARLLRGVMPKAKPVEQIETFADLELRQRRGRR